MKPKAKGSSSPDNQDALPAKNKNNKASPEEELLTGLQEFSRNYREEGLRLQRSGDLTGAKACYQKAIAADPAYAVAYNDLGVVYELEGDQVLAEQNYVNAISIDSGYLSAYSNLAMLYESQRKLKEALKLWEKRAELGMPEDPWTIRAYRRVNEVNWALGSKIDSFRERQIANLASVIADRKELIRQDEKIAAQASFEQSQTHYRRGDSVTALKNAIDAMQLDPDNDEIIGFAEKLQLRLLSE